jgi:nicotinamidase-related amidase
VRSSRNGDVFVDLCTQRDYLAASGTRPVSNASDVRASLKRVMALARWARIPLLSCVDAYRPVDVRGLARPQCVIGSGGQRKLACTLMPDHVFVDSDNCLCVSLDIFETHQQAVLSKAHRDPFTNPKFDRLLTEMPNRRYVVFGISLEESVRLLTLGLMLRHRPVTVVRDCCGWWDQEEGEMTLRQLEAKGCELITAQELVQRTLAAQKPARRDVVRRRSVA